GKSAAGGPAVYLQGLSQPAAQSPFTNPIGVRGAAALDYRAVLKLTRPIITNAVVSDLHPGPLTVIQIPNPLSLRTGLSSVSALAALFGASRLNVSSEYYEYCDEYRQWECEDSFHSDSPSTILQPWAVKRMT